MEARSIYRQVLGDQFPTLDAAVQQFHDCRGQHIFVGFCAITPASHWLARGICCLLRLPRYATHAPFEFVLQADSRREIWLRKFPGISMRSTLRSDRQRLIEQLGMVRFTFDLASQQGSLTMQLQSVSLLGVPIPRWAHPQIHAVEHGVGDRFYFDVKARWGWLGLISSYNGWLLVS